MFRKALVTSSILLLSTIANAEGGYAGLSVGKTDFDLSGFDDGNSLAITGGYKFSENFGIEASYIDLGEAKDDIEPIWTLEADGLNFAVVGIIPISETIGVFGKVGAFMWDASLDESGFGEIASDDGTDISFGFGATANFTEQFGIVFEYQKFNLDEEDATNMSIGARFNF